MPERAAGLYTRPFLVLCGSSFLFYLSFHLLMPVVPLFAAERLGVDEAQIGLVFGVFAFSAMIWRPLAGRLADTVGRRPFILLGAAVFTVASAAYGAVGGLAGLLALRFAHGVGMGFGQTASGVSVGDLAPPERRGEATGIYGLTTTTGLAIGPWIGVELARRAGYPAAFLASAAIAAVALALAWAIPETRPAGQPVPAAPRSWRDVLSPGALYPAALMVTLFFGWGAVVSFTAVYAVRAQLGHPGLFFTTFALAALAARSSAGLLSDRVGRRAVVAPALVIEGVSLAVMGQAGSSAGLILAAALFGVGFGAGQPALMAMTMDRVGPAERGRAMGTYFTAWELGISAGSVVLGLVAARRGFAAMWWTAAAVAWIGAVVCAPGMGRPRG